MGMENEMSLNCTQLDMTYVQCNDSMFKLEQFNHLSYTNEWFWIYIGIFVVLLILAGIFSGLSLGLLSLELTKLQMMKHGGLPQEREYAAKLLPLLKKRHLLLVTLLLGNTICLEAMPMFLDKLSNPIMAVTISVTVVLILGEILPQAIFARHGAPLGAALTPFVYVAMALLFVVAYPVSKVLDLMLGIDHPTLYRRAELKALVNLHGESDSANGDSCQRTQDVENAEKLTHDEFLMIQGVLEMRDKTARHAMIPIDSVFMLSIDECLDEATMIKILNSSYSRVPVYEGTFHQIVGILMVKALIQVDVRTPIPIRDLQQSRSLRPPHFISDRMSLFDLLNHFQTGKNHLSIVHMSDHWAKVGNKAPTPLSNDLLRKLVIGIITLEDIIEEMLQEEILDETDVYFSEMQKVLSRAIKKSTGTPKNEKENNRNELLSLSIMDSRATTPLLQHDSLP